MIEIRGLDKAYGLTRVLADVDLSASPGEVVALLGANGAGKSTLFRCLLGLTGYEGEIRVDGLDPLRHGREVRRRIGYMPQQDGLHADLTVAATLDFYARLRGVDATSATRLLHQVRLAEARDLRVDEISGGMRQRLAFALAQLGDPPVLLLDEPTASLDAVSREHLLGRVRSLAAAGRTILMATHAEPRFEAVGRSVVLDGGKLYEGTAVRLPGVPRRTAPAAFAGAAFIGWTVDSAGNAAGGGRC